MGSTPTATSTSLSCSTGSAASSPTASFGTTDAANAALLAWTRRHGQVATAIPKCRNGAVGKLRALVMARRGAIKARTQATNQLRALLVDADDELRGRLGSLRQRHLACADLHPDGGALHLALRSLGRRWLALHQEVTELDRAITTTVTRVAPRLLARHSVGVHTAARLLLTAGDNPTRLRSEAPSPPCAAPARSRPPPARRSATA